MTMTRDDLKWWAEVYWSSGALDGDKVRAQAQCIICMAKAQSLGLDPHAGVDGFVFMRGKFSMSAALMAAVVDRHPEFSYRVKTKTNQECKIEFLRGKESIGVASFDMGDAKKAGLGGNMYNKYPREMLWARAMSQGAKHYCAAAFGGAVYTPDELGGDMHPDDLEDAPGDGAMKAKMIAADVNAREYQPDDRGLGADALTGAVDPDQGEEPPPYEPPPSEPDPSDEPAPPADSLEKVMSRISKKVDAKHGKKVDPRSDGPTGAQMAKITELAGRAADLDLDAVNTGLSQALIDHADGKLTRDKAKALIKRAAKRIAGAEAAAEPPEPPEPPPPAFEDRDGEIVIRKQPPV